MSGLHKAIQSKCHNSVSRLSEGLLTAKTKVTTKLFVFFRAEPLLQQSEYLWQPVTCLSGLVANKRCFALTLPGITKVLW